LGAGAVGAGGSGHLLTPCNSQPSSWLNK
jgi:hypothetical protein